MCNSCQLDFTFLLFVASMWLNSSINYINSWIIIKLQYMPSLSVYFACVSIVLLVVCGRAVTFVVLLWHWAHVKLKDDFWSFYTVYSCSFVFKPNKLLENTWALLFSTNIQSYTCTSLNNWNVLYMLSFRACVCIWPQFVALWHTPPKQ